MIRVVLGMQFPIDYDKNMVVNDRISPQLQLFI